MVVLMCHVSCDVQCHKVITLTTCYLKMCKGQVPKKKKIPSMGVILSLPADSDFVSPTDSTSVKLPAESLAFSLLYD